MYALAVLHAHGRGTRADEMLAVHWLTRAADAGSNEVRLTCHTLAT